MNKFGEILIVTEFKEGDTICELNNYLDFFPCFFKADKWDAKNYSGSGKKYLKIVQTNN